MKQTITIVFALLVSATGATAQIKLEKPSIKAPKVSAPEISKPSSKESGSSGSSTVAAPESPAKDEIFHFGLDVSSGEDDLEHYKYENVKEYIDKCEANLKKIKELDPKWNDPKGYIPRFEKLKADYELKNGEFLMSRKLGDMRSAAVSIGESHRKAGDKYYAPFLNKAVYDSIKSFYTAHPDQIDDYAKASLATMDNFYAVELPKIRTYVLEDAEQYLRYTTYIKENRMKPGYLEGLGYNGLDPESSLTSIVEGEKYFANVILLFSDDAEFRKIHQTLADRKADLEQYIASADYQADIAKRRQLDIDSILIGAPGMTDAALDAVVKRDFNTSTWGAIQRISILDKSWNVRKNNFDLPIEKYMDVEVGVSKDGVCERVAGVLVCTYEGGGKYGKPYFVTQSSTIMNCANMKKNGTK